MDMWEGGKGGGVYESLFVGLLGFNFKNYWAQT
jgi:hypothetical protein